MKITRAQAILAYAVLILFVVSALIAMSGYIKRRIQGSYKQAGDAFGQEEVD
jgi:uncharacterized protein (UPF0333 family)